MRNLAPALALLADVVLRPTFPAGELDRLKKERLAALVQAQDNPAAIIGYAFPRVVFGPTHRYGTPATGLAPAIEAITADDVRAFYKEHYVSGNAAIVVTGDVTMAAVKAELDKAFAAWPSSGPRGAAAPLPVAPQLTRREVVLVDKPGAAQSQIRIGWVGVPRSTPDYATLEVLNTVLGGSFGSRLNQNLRERNGYTYGAASAFDMRASPGPFFATAGVQTDKTADALREFFVELEGIRKPIPAPEIEKAKNYVALELPREFETTRNLAQKLEELIVYSLPEDTHQSFVGAVAKVTAADVQSAAARYIQPDKMAVVIVGDRKAIEPGIAHAQPRAAARAVRSRSSSNRSDRRCRRRGRGPARGHRGRWRTGPGPPDRADGRWRTQDPDQRRRALQRPAVVLAPERFVTDSPTHLMRGMLRAWPLPRMVHFFENDVGVPLALEADTGKLFPRSNRARDVRDGLVTLARRRGVGLRFHTSMEA